jgi:Fe2+ transport system protein FeoA
MSLWSLSVGASASVSSVIGGTHNVAAQRLIDIGFRKGQSVSCLLQPGFGAPRVFALGNAIYSLDKETADLVILTDDIPS